MNKLKLFYPLLLTIFLAGGVWIGYVISPGAIRGTNASNYNKLRDIINILDKDYVDTINAHQLFESAITDMLHQLDPHSSYIPKEDLLAAKERVDGVFGGIGVRFFMLRDTVAVSNVIPQSPSMRAGLHAGDRIIKVNGETIAGKKMPTDSIMKLLKGPANSTVDVTLLRNHQEIKTQIRRGLIPYSSVSVSYMLTPSIGYVKIDEFSKTTAGEFRAATQRLKQEGMQKIVVDLRNNGGGVLDAAIQIADEFLPKGKLILTTKGKNFQKEEIYATAKGSLEKMPVVILINEGSASASEVLTGALQDQDRATVVGRRSFGKGLVQQDIPLSDGSNLRLVVARYYTPTGRCIQKPYTGGYEKYMHEYYNRYEDGELYHVDSTKFVDSLKYRTPKGKIVYGGGGIFPDVFVPLDTTSSSWYVAELYYKGAFQSFGFDFVANKRSKWSSMFDFKKNFTVSDELLKKFLRYVNDDYHIVPDKNTKVSTIKQLLKAEIVRQLWEEEGYSYVSFERDDMVMKSIELLNKK